MNYIDILLCIPLIWGFYRGFTKGLIIEVFSLLAFALGVWSGVYFSDYLVKKINEWFDWQYTYLPIISFAITFLLVAILIYFIAKIIQNIIEGMLLGAFNKIGGAIFGTLKFAFIISIGIFVVNLFRIDKVFPANKTIEKSMLYQPIKKIAPLIIPNLIERKWTI